MCLNHVLDFSQFFPAPWDILRNFLPGVFAGGFFYGVMGVEQLYLVGRYDQRWRLGEDGRYAEIPDWYGGIGFQTAFGID